MDAYCWLHSTVHLDTSLLRKLNTMPQVRAPCIGLNTPTSGLDPSNTPMETLYYQWVPFFLLFQVRKITKKYFRVSNSRSSSNNHTYIVEIVKLWKIGQNTYVRVLDTLV